MATSQKPIKRTPSAKRYDNQLARARKIARQAVDAKISNIAEDLGAFLDGGQAMAAHRRLVAALTNSDDDNGVAETRAAFLIGLELGQRIGAR